MCARNWEDNDLKHMHGLDEAHCYIYLQDTDNAVFAPACGLGEDGDVLLNHHVAPHRAGVTLGPAPAQHGH